MSAGEFTADGNPGIPFKCLCVCVCGGGGGEGGIGERE